MAFFCLLWDAPKSKSTPLSEPSNKQDNKKSKKNDDDSLSLKHSCVSENGQSNHIHEMNSEKVKGLDESALSLGNTFRTDIGESIDYKSSSDSSYSPQSDESDVSSSSESSVSSLEKSNESSDEECNDKSHVPSPEHNELVAEKNVTKTIPSQNSIASLKKLLKKKGPITESLLDSDENASFNSLEMCPDEEESSHYQLCPIPW